MKIPCELIVWYVLPSIRRELARELVQKHHLSQAEVARKFGVTDAAISQYLKAKRGTNKELENSGRYEDFKREVEISAVRIINGSDIVVETCRICEMVKRTGCWSASTRLRPACGLPPASARSASDHLP